MRFAVQLGVKLYSTAGVLGQDRHEAWVNGDWPSLGPVYRTSPLAPFDVVSDGLRLGELIVRPSSPPTSW